MTPADATMAPFEVAEIQVRYGRQMPDPVKDAELRESVRLRGVLEPVHLSARHVLLSGHRRVATCLELGLATVPAVVHPEVATPEQELAFVLTGDVKGDRHPAETAFLLGRYCEERKVTWAAGAAEFGFSPAKASRLKTVTEQPQAVLDLFRGGRLTLVQLVEVARAPIDRREALAREAVEKRLSPAEIRRRVRHPAARAKRKGVLVRLSGLVLTVPADMPLAAFREHLATLAAAAAKAGALNLGADALPNVVASLERNK